MAKQKHWTFWLLSIVAVWAMLFLIYGWKSTQYMLELYYKAAEAMYAGADPTGVDAMAYPPLLVAEYIPFLVLENHALAQRVAMLGVMACLLVFIFSTLQTMVVGKHSFKKTAMFWVLVALLVGRYVVSPIENYSHDIFVAGPIVLALRLWAQKRETLGGIAIGVAAACKATPLLFLPFLALQKRWKALTAMTIATVITFFLPDILFPRDQGTWAGYWFTLVLNSLHITEGEHVVGNWSRWNQLNQSLSGTIERLFSFPAHPSVDAVDVRIMNLSAVAIAVITNIVRIGIIGVIFMAFRTQTKSPLAIRRFCEGAILVCGMLLLSPISSKAHFFLLLLPAVVMVRCYVFERKDWVLMCIFIIMFVYGTLTVKDLVGTNIGHAILATGSVTWCTILALLGTWRVMCIDQLSAGSS